MKLRFLHPLKLSNRNAGFTLVELLVVITIIAILMGLAFPGLRAAMNAAKKAEAGAMIAQLKTSVASFQTEYGRLPMKTLGNPTEDIVFEAGELYFVLIGQEEAGVMDNPRGISFMEFNMKYLRQGMADQTNQLPPDNPMDADTFVDPWNQEYQMVLDFDYDKRLDVPDTSKTAMEQDIVTINAKSAIWSFGGDSTRPRGYVKSW